MQLLWRRTLHQSWLVVWLCVGVISGVVIGLVLRVNYFASPIWVACALLMLVFAYFKPRYALMVIALIAGMMLAFFRVSAEIYDEDYIRQFYNQEIVVTGTVRGDPVLDSQDMVKLKITDLRFGEVGKIGGKNEEGGGRIGDGLRRAGGSIYVTLGTTAEIMRSDVVVFEGKLLDGFGTYAGYLYKPRLKALMRPGLGDLSLKTRNWFANRVKGIIKKPEVDLGLSYLLGMKAGLSEELSEQLRTVGLVHIVVASGAHLSILVEVARKIFGGLSRVVGLIFSIVFVIFFMSVVGWTPSIMRAGVMAILTLVAWQSGRVIAPWRLILMVAAFTLMLEPSFVMDLGWLLSFASFTGIMMLGPSLVKFFYGARKPGFVASAAMTTISATLMTLPITLYYFGQVSLISVIANLLMLPTLSWAMGLVFLTGVVAEIPVVSMVVGWCAMQILSFHIAVVEFFGKMEQFLVKIEAYQVWVFGLYLAIILPWVGRIIWKKIRKNKNYDKMKL